MKYRQLGHTGLCVSEIGFGAWGIGGLSLGSTSYGPTDDHESLAALRAAVEHGITFYDTSDLYGYGHSEELIGKALKGLRRKVVLASKVGFLEHNGPQDFSPRHIRAALERSLLRLQTDYLDLYQLHNPPVSLLRHEHPMIAELRSLQQEGKIRAFGVSVRSPDDGLEAIEVRDMGAIQVNLNMVDQRALENELLDRSARAGIGIICRTPLAFGFLSGRYPRESVFDPRHHCSTWPRAQIELWANAPYLFQAAAADTPAQNHAQRALRFCLSYQGVATVIPGMLHPSEVKENIVASRLGPLSSVEREHIEQVYKTHTFFLGKPSEMARQVPQLGSDQ